MLDDELEVNLIFFKKKNGSDQRRSHMTKPHALPHKVSAFIYILSYISLSHISYPDIRKGKKKLSVAVSAIWWWQVNGLIDGVNGT